MSTLTTNYSLIKPGVNDPTDQDLWGGYLNTNFDSLDTLLKTATDRVVRSISTTDTVLITDSNKTLLCDATGGAFTETLLPAATAGDGFCVTIIKSDSSANAVTVDGDGSETISGALTYALSSEGDAVILVSDGSNWFISANKGELDASETVKGIIELATQAEVDAGSDAVRAVTPATLATSSLIAQITNTTTGKIVLGVITVQWGTFSSSGGTGTITFGTAFSAAPYHVGAENDTNSNDWVVNTYNRTTTGCTIHIANAGSRTGTWFAIGAT